MAVAHLYGRSTSFNVQKIQWLLDELELNYQHTELGGRFGGLDEANFLTLNPMGKVPLWVEDKQTVWESHAILRFLAAKFDSKSLWWKQDIYQRSIIDRWMDWSHLTFQPAFMEKFWSFYRTPEPKRDWVGIDNAITAVNRCLSLLDQQIDGRRYLCGENITLADIPAGAALYRLTEQGLNIELPDNVERWYQELCNRPAYQNRIMCDFSELAGRETF